MPATTRRPARRRQRPGCAWCAEAQRPAGHGAARRPRRVAPAASARRPPRRAAPVPRAAMSWACPCCARRCQTASTWTSGWSKGRSRSTSCSSMPVTRTKCRGSTVSRSELRHHAAGREELVHRDRDAALPPQRRQRLVDEAVGPAREAHQQVARGAEVRRASAACPPADGRAASRTRTDPHTAAAPRRARPRPTGRARSGWRSRRGSSRWPCPLPRSRSSWRGSRVVSGTHAHRDRRRLGLHDLDEAGDQLGRGGVGHRQHEGGVGHGGVEFAGCQGVLELLQGVAHGRPESERAGVGSTPAPERRTSSSPSTSRSAAAHCSPRAGSATGCGRRGSGCARPSPRRKRAAG